MSDDPQRCFGAQEEGSVPATRSDTNTSHGDLAGPRPVGGPGAEDRSDAAARDFAAWRAGDPAALDRLVRLLTPVLWHLARAHGLERQAAEDVVQSTWIAMFRHADSLRDPQAVLRWTTITTRREAWRVAAAARREDSVEPAVLDRPGPMSASPEAVVLASHQMHSLWRHVQALSARCQRLLRVIAFEDRPDYASLSVQLGMPLGGIGPTRRRCLDKLRDRLSDDPDWSDR
jgi:RNA polymerase sigma factor (sigma-70 family)